MPRDCAGEVDTPDRSGMDRAIYWRQCMDLLSEPMTQKIPPRTLFSQAWATVLRPRYAELIKDFYYTPRIRFRAGDEPEIAINFLTAIHERNLILLNNRFFRGV